MPFYAPHAPFDEFTYLFSNREGTSDLPLPYDVDSWIEYYATRKGVRHFVGERDYSIPHNPDSPGWYENTGEKIQFHFPCSFLGCQKHGVNGAHVRRADIFGTLAGNFIVPLCTEHNSVDPQMWFKLYRNNSPVRTT